MPSNREVGATLGEEARRAMGEQPGERDPGEDRPQEPAPKSEPAPKEPAPKEPAPPSPGLAPGSKPGEPASEPPGAAQDLNNTTVAYEPAPLPGSPATRDLETSEAPLVTAGGNPAKPGTTRDRNDLGVPMLPGRGDEPQGPEDALGLGPKRGDYTGRIGPSSYQPHAHPVDAQGRVIGPLEPQRPRAADIGDVPGKKGGVETASEAAG